MRIEAHIHSFIVTLATNETLLWFGGPTRRDEKDASIVWLTNAEGRALWNVPVGSAREVQFEEAARLLQTPVSAK